MRDESEAGSFLDGSGALAIGVGEALRRACVTFVRGKTRKRAYVSLKSKFDPTCDLQGECKRTIL